MTVFNPLNSLTNDPKPPQTFAAADLGAWRLDAFTTDGDPYWVTPVGSRGYRLYAGPADAVQFLAVHVSLDACYIATGTR